MMNKYLTIGVSVVALIIISYLMGKLYFTQQDLLKCQDSNKNLEFTLKNQNNEILKYKATTSKDILIDKETQLNTKYNKLKSTLTKEVNSCQSVVDTYLKLINNTQEQ